MRLVLECTDAFYDCPFEVALETHGIVRRESSHEELTATKTQDLIVLCFLPTTVYIFLLPQATLVFHPIQNAQIHRVIIKSQSRPNSLYQNVVPLQNVHHSMRYHDLQRDFFRIVQVQFGEKLLLKVKR